MKNLAVIRGGAAGIFLLTLLIPGNALSGESMIFSDGFESDNTAVQIAAVRLAPDGPANLSIANATVTYTKPLVGSDVAGFFVQSSKAGPALFIAVDPAVLTPQPVSGDRVSFIVAQMATSLGLRQATQISNFARNASSQPLAGLVQNVTAVSDLVSAVDTYESELISLNGVITGSFTAAGTGFEAAAINTTGISGDSNFRLRLPVTLREAEDLVTGCEFTLGPTPFWRALAQAQPSAWFASDIAATSCPAPSVASAVAQSTSSVVIEFSRRIDPSSIQPNGSQFTFDNGLLALAASVTGRQVILTTSAQVGGQVYQMLVQNTVTDTLGAALQLPNQAAFQGYLQSAQVLINEINANITLGCDLVELRVTSGGSMAGFELFERDTSVLAFEGLLVDIGDIIVVHFNGGSASCSGGSGSGNETTSKTQFPSSQYLSNYDSAWDWYSLDAGIINTDNVLTLYDMDGNIQDAVFVSDDVTGTAVASTEGQAAIVAAAGGWEMIGGGIPPGGFVDDDFNAHAVLDLNATDTGKVGITIQRVNLADINTKADWGQAAFSWGLLNSGQTP